MILFIDLFYILFSKLFINLINFDIFIFNINNINFILINFINNTLISIIFLI